MPEIVSVFGPTLKTVLFPNPLPSVPNEISPMPPIVTFEPGPVEKFNVPRKDAAEEELFQSAAVLLVPVAAVLPPNTEAAPLPVSITLPVTLV